MIEGIAAQVVTPQQPVQIPQTVLPAPSKTDTSAFNNILQQADVSKLGDLKVDTKNINNDISKALNAVTNSDTAYRQMLDQRQSLGQILSPPQDKMEQFKIRTVDDLNDGKDKPLIDQFKESFRSNLDKTQQVHERIANVVAWSTNMTIFSSTMKSASDGFKTLFRSSG